VSQVSRSYLIDAKVRGSLETKFHSNKRMQPDAAESRSLRSFRLPILQRRLSNNLPDQPMALSAGDV
jgi:hypothetical protein